MGKARLLSVMAASVAAMSLSFAGAADAAGVKSLFLVAENQSGNAQMLDILTGDARFDLTGSAQYDYSVNGNPTLAYLQQFDSVLFSANNPPNTALGNMLADYVDSGGGVVITSFNGYYQAYAQTYTTYSIGRLDDLGYNPLAGGTTDAYQYVSLGTHIASDPLMQGVSALSSSAYNGDYTIVRAGSTLAASWDNGRPLAAYNAAHNVADITLFPNIVTYSNASGDYRRLFANALAFTGSAAPEPASWTMLLIGFGAMGGVLRAARRRPAVA